MGLSEVADAVDARPTCVSIAGQSHVRVGKVNQDAAGSWLFNPASPTPPTVAGSATSWPMNEEWMSSLMEAAGASPGQFVALAVSDGHGSARYDRSDRGSAIAVWLALQVAAVAASRMADITLNRKDWLEVEVPRRLVAQWRRFVLEDAGDQSDGDMTDDTIRRYGATILGCVVTADAAAFWQLGDGEMTIVGANGKVERPLPEIEKMFGTETRSLCLPDAVGDCRVSARFDHDLDEAEIVLATDGLPNSYPTDDDYDEFLLGALERRSGLGPSFRNSLIRWMGRASSHSGDDVSIAMSGTLRTKTTKERINE